MSNKEQWIETLKRLYPLIMLTIVILVIVLYAVACAPAPETVEKFNDAISSKIQVYVDRQYDVVCFYAYNAGLDCIPLSDLE